MKKNEKEIWLELSSHVHVHVGTYVSNSRPDVPTARPSKQTKEAPELIVRKGFFSFERSDLHIQRKTTINLRLPFWDKLISLWIIYACLFVVWNETVYTELRKKNKERGYVVPWQTDRQTDGQTDRVHVNGGMHACMHAWMRDTPKILFRPCR